MCRCDHELVAASLLFILDNIFSPNNTAIRIHSSKIRSYWPCATSHRHLNILNVSSPICYLEYNMGIACTCARNNLGFAERHSNCFARAPCRNVAAVDANIRIIRLIRTKMVRAWWQHKRVTACYSLWPSFFTNGQFCVVRLSCQLSKPTDRLGYVVPCEWSESWGSGGGDNYCSGCCEVLQFSLYCLGEGVARLFLRTMWLCITGSIGRASIPLICALWRPCCLFWSACLDLCRGRE